MPEREICGNPFLLRKGKKSMRLSTTINFFIYDDDGSYEAYKKDLRHYAELGFRNLDCIFCSATEPNSPLRTPHWEDWAKAIREEADRLGVTFVQTHVPFYNFCHPVTGVNKDTEDIVRKSIVCTEILGAKWTVSHPGTDFAASLHSVNLEKNKEYFARHLALAEKHGVGLCIENMADFPGQGFKRSYCATVEDLAELVDLLGERFSNVGICWDFGHANLVYRDQVPCLKYLGKRIKVTHVHDNSGTNDEHRFPYLGNVNWEAIMPTLTEIGYEGDFSFEVKRIGLGTHLPEEIKDSMWLHMKRTGEYLLTLA